MAAPWFLTRAAVKLLLFQDNDLSYSIQPVITIKIADTTQGEMSDGSEAVNNLLPSLETWKMLKTVLSKRKLKISELVIPHDTLFHYQLKFTTHLTWNVTNVIFIFANSPNTRPKEKNVGWTEHIMPPVWKTEGARSPCPYLIAPMTVSALGSSVKLADRRECSFCNYTLLQGFISYRNLFDFLLRLVVLKRLGFQSQKYGIPICTSIINFTLSVSEYVTTIVTAKPVTILCETNPCCTVVSHMCSCKTITVSRK